MRYKRHYNVPSSNKRACLCRDGHTYSRSCCDSEDYFAQGIGSLTGPIGFLLQENGFNLLQEDNSKIEL